MVFRFPTVIFFPFFLPQPLAPVQHTKPHTHTPMIHWSTYPNPSPHTEPHTHIQTQTIKPSTEPHTHKPSNQLEPTTATTPTTQATDQQTQAIDQKPTPPIWNPGCRKYPEKRQKYPSHQSETHATDFRKYPEKCRWSIQKKSKIPKNTQAIDQKPKPSKIPSKTKTKPKLKQHHQSKPIQKKSLLEPPSELPMINPTDPPTNQQIHCFQPTNQPIQTHHQPNPAHDPNPARWSKLDPTSKIQNPRLVRDKERKWESKWERERIKYCF